MKVLLYPNNSKLYAKSGIAMAVRHQKKALEINDVEYTSDIKDDFDLLHVNTFGLPSYLLARKVKRQGKPVVVHAHTTEEDFRNSFILSNKLAPLLKKWLKKMYNTGDIIITPTPYSKKLLIAYKLSPPIFNISNGVDINHFKQNREVKGNFRQKYNFSMDDKIILSVGLHIERKGIFDFVEIAKRMPEYKFFWCGYTNPRLIPKKVRKLLKKPPENVFFPGFVDNMKDAYNSADLFLFLSHEETEGIVVLEALSSQIPVIVRNIGVYEEWLKDGVNCKKASTTDQFIELINEVIEKGSGEILNAGKLTAYERSLDKVGALLKDRYERLLENK